MAKWLKHCILCHVLSINLTFKIYYIDTYELVCMYICMYVCMYVAGTCICVKKGSSVFLLDYVGK